MPIIIVCMDPRAGHPITIVVGGHALQREGGAGALLGRHGGLHLLHHHIHIQEQLRRERRVNRRARFWLVLVFHFLEKRTSGAKK